MRRSALWPNTIGLSEAGRGSPGRHPAILPGPYAAVNRPPVTPLIGTSRLGVSVARPAEVPAGLGRANAALAASLRHRGPGVALMIVGGAGLVTGLLVEEPIITVVGAGVGLRSEER